MVVTSPPFQCTFAVRISASRGAVTVTASSRQRAMRLRSWALLVGASHSAGRFEAYKRSRCCSATLSGLSRPAVSAVPPIRFAAGFSAPLRSAAPILAPPADSPGPPPRSAAGPDASRSVHVPPSGSSACAPLRCPAHTVRPLSASPPPPKARGTRPSGRPSSPSSRSR